jgi:uncharacterized protein
MRAQQFRIITSTLPAVATWPCSKPSSSRGYALDTSGQQRLHRVDSGGLSRPVRRGRAFAGRRCQCLCAGQTRQHRADGRYFQGELKIARRLLATDCNPDQRNGAGQTAAMYAGLFKRVELLNELNQGADLNAEDPLGNSAARLAKGEIRMPAAIEAEWAIIAVFRLEFRWQRPSAFTAALSAARPFPSGPASAASAGSWNTLTKPLIESGSAPHRPAVAPAGPGNKPRSKPWRKSASKKSRVFPQHPASSTGCWVAAWSTALWC